MSLILNGMAAATSEEQNPLDQQACKRAAGVLFKYYPGHSWAVDISGGIMNIRSQNLSTNYGWRQRLDEMSPSDFDRKIRRAGGEILERYNMPTQAMDIQIYQELPRDLRGAPLRDSS